jgi:hypothetical protein
MRKATCRKYIHHSYVNIAHNSHSIYTYMLPIRMVIAAVVASPKKSLYASVCVALLQNENTVAARYVHSSSESNMLKLDLLLAASNAAKTTSQRRPHALAGSITPSNARSLGVHHF